MMKDQIDKTLNSLEGLERLQPSILIADRIYKKAKETSSVVTEQPAFPLSWVIGFAAMIVLNLGLLYWVNNNNQGENYASAPTLSEFYFSSDLSY